MKAYVRISILIALMTLMVILLTSCGGGGGGDSAIALVHRRQDPLRP
jgi:hypothetical protein